MTWQKFNSVACYRGSVDVGIQSFGPGESNGRAVDYTTFVQEVGQGQIQDAQFNNSEITFTRRGGGSKYVTYMPVYDQKLLDDLINQNVKFRVHHLKSRAFLALSSSLGSQ